MEHVIRYRILGHHPAASGKYYNTGFSGEFLLVRQFLEEIVREHQINLSAFKTVMTLVTPNATANLGSNSGILGDGSVDAGGQGTSTSTVLYLDDHLHNYDSVDITVSKRSLTDDAEAAEEERRAQAQNRLKAAEEQFHLLDTVSFPTTGAAAAATNANGAGQWSGRHHANLTEGKASPAPSSSTVDAMALQRATALASKFFPVRQGQHSGLESQDSSENDHVCVLCELPSVHEVFTACCHYSVCSTCLASAQAMMPSEEECPVCGRQNPSEAQDRTGQRHQRRKNVKTQQPADDEKKVIASGGVKRGAPPTEAAMQERTRAPQPPQQQLQRRRLEGDQGRAVSSTHSQGNTAKAAVSHGARPSGQRLDDYDDDERKPVLNPAVLRTEEELRESLDRTLAFLDAPDPLTSEMKATRVKSAALAALDEAE